MRTFVKLREMMATHKDLARKLEELEKKYDGQFQVVFEAIRLLIEIDEEPKRKIGYIRESRAVYRTPGPWPLDPGPCTLDPDPQTLTPENEGRTRSS
jgi:hypothetical protein